MGSLSAGESLAATGRTITAAASITILVFGGKLTIKLFGVGLAGAVVLDAVVVHSILIPGLMLTLGHAIGNCPRRSTASCPTSTSKGEARIRSLSCPFRSSRRPAPDRGR